MAREPKTGKKRVNNPPVGLVTPELDRERGVKAYAAYAPHQDPQLQWSGKAEHTSFEVPTVPLPSQLGDYKKIAVKIVDDRGIESLKIMEVA